MPYITSIERIGREEGRQEGRAEGRQEGEARFAVQLLTRRFGSLPSALQTQVERLTVEQLDRLSFVLLDFESMADLEA